MRRHGVEEPRCKTGFFTPRFGEIWWLTPKLRSPRRGQISGCRVVVSCCPADGRPVGDVLLAERAAIGSSGCALLAALLLSHQLGDGNARIPRITELYIFFGEARRDLLECVKSHFLRTRTTLLKSLTFGNMRLYFAISTSKSLGKRAFCFGKMRWNLCSHLYFSRKDVVVIAWKQVVYKNNVGIFFIFWINRYLCKAE